MRCFIEYIFTDSLQIVVNTTFSKMKKSLFIMKKLVLLIFIILLLFCSCSTSSPQETGNSNNIQTNETMEDVEMNQILVVNKNEISGGELMQLNPEDQNVNIPFIAIMNAVGANISWGK